MSEESNKVINDMVANREAGWTGFMSFSKISIILIFIALALLAWATL